MLSGIIASSQMLLILNVLLICICSKGMSDHFSVVVLCSPNHSDLAVWVSQLKTPKTNPIFIPLALHLLILYGACMLSVNNNVVSLLQTLFHTHFAIMS